MTDSILSFLIGTHLKAALLVGVAWIAADLVFRKASASARHAFLAVGFAAALAVPLMAFVPASMLRVELPVSAPAVATTAHAMPLAAPGTTAPPTLDRPLFATLVEAKPPAAAATQDASVESPEQELSARKGPLAIRKAMYEERERTRPPAPSLGTMAPPAPPAPPASAGRQFAASALGWFALVWALGAALHLLRLGVLHGLVAWHSGSARRLDDPELDHLARRYAHAFGLASPLRLLSSERVRIPYMHGLRTITVVLPAGCLAWDRERWELVLKHELAHAHRRDYVWQCLATVACALHWFNPLFWRAATRLRLESERACDDIVVASGARPSSYARLLADFACLGLPKPEASAALAITRRHDLVLRVEAILDPATPRPSQGINPMKRCILLTAALVAALTLIDVRLVADSPESGQAADKATATAKADDGLYDVNTPSNDLGEAWFSLAWAAHQAGDYEYSSVGFMKAFDRQYNEHLSAYNSACAFAQLGRTDDAFRWLDAAIDHGFTDKDMLKKDDDLASLRKDPRFAAAAKKAAEAAKSEYAKHQVIVEQSDEPAERVDLATLDRRETERRAKTRGDWENMVAVSKELATDLNDVGDVHFRLGYAYLMLNQPQDAIPHFERCLELDEFEGMANYNLACANATLGNTEKALEFLAEAADSWGMGALQMRSDYDLRALRGGADFEALVAELASRKHEMSWELGSLAPMLGNLRQLEHLGGQLEGLGAITRREGMMVTPIAGHTINPYSGAVIPLKPGATAADVPEELREPGAALFNLALELHSHGGFAEAIAGFKRCHEAGELAEVAAYNVACGLARLGSTDEAFQWIDRAIEAGLAPNVVHMADDADLFSLHDDPRFDAAVERLKANPPAEEKTKDKAEDTAEETAGYGR